MKERSSPKESVMSDRFRDLLLAINCVSVTVLILLLLYSFVESRDTGSDSIEESSLTFIENSDRIMALDHILVCMDQMSSDEAFTALQEAVAILDGPIDSISAERSNSSDCDIHVVEKYVFNLDYNEQTFNMSKSYAWPDESKAFLNKFLYKSGMDYCGVATPIHELLHILLGELNNYPGVISSNKFHSSIPDEVMSPYCIDYAGKPAPKLSPKEFFYIRAAQKNARNKANKE
jgi:hypothetical protein